MHDLVIRNGTIVDGTGDAPFQGDIAIDDGSISAIGRIEAEGRETVDATGQIITPGFVDIHTHFDGQITWDPLLTPSCWHGVTTVVMGNCGVGFAPAAPNRHEWLIGLMEGVEDIPGTALSAGMQWNWETFPEYLDYLDTLPKALDVGTQVPHGAVRAYVMGERGASNEPANPEDILEMKKLVREGIEAGALGVSTSRTIVHRAIDGVNVPGTFAEEDEMMAFGEALSEAGTGVFELAPAGVTGDDMNLPDLEVAWMRRVSAATGRPITFALVQLDAEPDHWKRMFDLSEEAAAEGADLYPQVTARAPGVLLGLQTNHPWVNAPTFQEISGHYKLGEGDAHHLRRVPIEEVAAEMRKPEIKAKLIEELEAAHQDIAFINLGRVFQLQEPLDYEPSEEDSVAAMAEREGREAHELFYDLLLEDDGKRLFFAPTLNYTDFNYDVVRKMLTHPRAALGLDDAGAHCGVICDASMPTFMLTHWARDRSRGEGLPLEFVVKKMTSDTARLYGLNDRGVLKPGMKGDVNVIDLERLQLRAPELAHDLPADGRRLVQRAEGFVATIVSGEVIMRDGEDTGARPGQLVRGEQQPAVSVA
ncbi:MAG: amidohydrolase family protein [Dehalococcoidia bacterium]|nr:amidohydrolase family protein [Dehalococcoidia bacterium]